MVIALICKSNNHHFPLFIAVIPLSSTKVILFRGELSVLCAKKGELNCKSFCILLSPKMALCMDYGMKKRAEKTLSSLKCFIHFASKFFHIINFISLCKKSREMASNNQHFFPFSGSLSLSSSDSGTPPTSYKT